MLEVEILEISRSRLQDLGIAYPTTATLTPSSLVTGAAASSGLRLSDLSHQNSNTIGISQLSVTLNAMKQVGLVNTLASPRIRARNKEKAKILIGQREPVITNSVTPTAGGTAVVTGSVQYLDVGLTLEVQPTIYLDGDVAIKINLEVSSILKQVTTASGTIAYEIGTRNANTMLRLKDGETQILAGLIQDSDTRNFSSIPGLGDIPILGQLFGTKHSDREKSEVVLSVTPRIIRMQPRPSNETTEFWYGNESRTRTQPYSAEMGTSAAPRQGAAPTGGAAPAPAAVPAPGTAPSGVQPVAPSIPPSDVSAPLSGPLELPGTGAGSGPGPTNKTQAAQSTSQGLPVTAPPAPIVAADAGAAASGAAGAGGGGHSALSVDGPSDAKLGDEFDVHVQLSSQDPITHLRAQLRYDSSALQIVSASVGEVVPAGAGSPSVNTRGVGAQLDVTTPPEDPVLGTGTLMTVRFKALAPRSGSSIAAMLNVLGGTGAAVGSTAAQPLVLNIHP
jgi:general secretion pathway protein D